MSSQLRDAAIRLAVIVGDGMFAYQVGPALTCIEAEAVADVARAVGRNVEADRWLEGHASEDGDGDLHYEAAVPGDGGSDSLTGRDG